MGVRRYLLVLDMDLLAVDEELDLEPINHLVARQEQEPCEVVVMSLVRSRQATGRQGGSSLARRLRRDPIHQLRLRLGARLIVFPPGPGALHRTPPA